MRGISSLAGLRLPALSLLAVLALATLNGPGILSAAVGVDNLPPSATLGQFYSFRLSSTGGTSPYVTTLLSGSLPEGLQLQSDGLIAGVPSVAGEFAVTVQSTDAVNMKGVTALSIRVDNGSGLRISPLTLPIGRLNQPFTATLTAQGGTAPYSWDVTLGDGQLPSGITVSANGEVRGTPTLGGTYPFNVRVTDAVGNSFQIPTQIRIESGSFLISTTSLPTGSANQPYSQSINAMGGTAPYVFTIAAGALPPGITLSSAGLLAGAATSSGVFPFTIRATDAQGLTTQTEFSLAVSQAGLNFILPIPSNAILNQPFNTSISASGGTPPYTFGLSSGSFPPGIFLSPDGKLSGTPTASGVFTATFRVLDSAARSKLGEITINVNSGSFNITTATAPLGFLNTDYSLPLTVSGGTAPIVYSVQSGALPPGLTLSAAGVLLGKPTAAGAYSFVVLAVDATGATAQAPLQLRIEQSLPLRTSGGLANAQLGQPYSSTLSARNGAPPYNFSLISGALPSGLTLAGNGNISGTPTSSGLYTITYSLSDANTNSTRADLTLFVDSSGLLPATLALPSAILNRPYSATLNARGGLAPYSYELAAGTLPAGLTLSSAGLLAGTPTTATPSTATSADYFTVRIRDTNGATTSASYRLNINPSALTTTSTPPPNGQIAVNYRASLSATGGTAPYTYSLSSGALPPGLSLSNEGVFSGIPTAPGTYTYSLLLTDSTGARSVFPQVISIRNPLLAFISGRLPEVIRGVPYFAAYSAVSGVAPYTFSLLSGSLPAGISLAANGNLTGISTALGTYPVTIRVIDGDGASATIASTITVGTGYLFDISALTLPPAVRGTPYSFQFTATGGELPYTFQLERDSQLPAGLSLSLAGLLSGTASTTGSTSFVVRGRDQNGYVVRKTFTLEVVAAAPVSSQASPALIMSYAFEFPQD